MPHNNRQVRLIGGRWGGRKLSFPEQLGLRPTSDRIRETLFNWLTPYIQGALCLDLFAGSGALGFEALSRGARHAVLVDQSREVVAQLRKNAEQLGVPVLTELGQTSAPRESQPQASVAIYCSHFSSHVVLPNFHYNLVFLDPPFHKGLLAESCEWLQQQDFLANNALIYLENASNDPLELPSHWHTIKVKKAGQVQYSLVQYTQSILV